jgi:ubiquinone/menaquinone biosynthesis C-methylase UbiE
LNNMVFNPLNYDKWYDDNRTIFQREIYIIKEAGIEGLSAEIGAGTGKFSSELGIKFAVDISRDMIEFAKNRVENVLVGSACSLPFRSKSFDTLVFAFSMSFIKCKDQAINEAMRVAMSAIILDFDPEDSYFKDLKLQYPEIGPFNLIKKDNSKIKINQNIKLDFNNRIISLILIKIESLI